MPPSTGVSSEPGPTTSPSPTQARGPGGLDTDALRRSWPDVLDWLSRHKRVTWTFVAQNAQVADYDGQRVLLAISTVGLADTFRRGAHADYVRQALIDVLGVDARVEGVASDDGGSGARPAPVAAAPTAADPAASAGPTTRTVRPSADAPDRGADVAATPPADAPGDSSTGPRPLAGTASSGATPVARAAAQSTPSAAGTEPSTQTRPGRGSGDGGPASESEPASWSAAPPPHATAPSWASPERPGEGLADQARGSGHAVDDSAISDDDESIDDLADVGVPVVERLLGGTVISEDSR